MKLDDYISKIELTKEGMLVTLIDGTVYKLDNKYGKELSHYMMQHIHRLENNNS